MEVFTFNFRVIQNWLWRALVKMKVKTRLMTRRAKRKQLFPAVRWIPALLWHQWRFRTFCTERRNWRRGIASRKDIANEFR
jgi:hypothetical protein